MTAAKANYDLVIDYIRLLGCSQTRVRTWGCCWRSTQEQSEYDAGDRQFTLARLPPKVSFATPDDVWNCNATIVAGSSISFVCAYLLYGTATIFLKCLAQTLTKKAYKSLLQRNHIPPFEQENKSSRKDAEHGIATASIDCGRSNKCCFYHSASVDHRNCPIL